MTSLSGPSLQSVALQWESFAQAPMVPLTDIARRLVGELFGVHLADAAAVFGTPEAIQSMCTNAGFAHPIQVILQGCGCHKCGLQN